MSKQEASNLLSFLMDIDNYTEEEITEYIKKSGMNLLFAFAYSSPNLDEQETDIIETIIRSFKF